MIGVETAAPSSVVLRSTLPMSRSTRGRSLKARQAVMFSTALISSSAPAAQKAKEAGGIFARACSSKASKSTLSKTSS